MSLLKVTAVVAVLITAEESTGLLLPSQEVLSERSENDRTVAAAGT